MTDNKWFRLLVALAWAAVTVAVGGVATLVWWFLQPVELPTIDEPIPILNEDTTIAVGEAIVMELRIIKPQPTDVIDSARFIQCESGNLITMTSTTRDLPVGDFTVISDSAILPDKIVTGDTCEFVFAVEYRINPVRNERTEYSSEPFVVVEDKGARL